MTQGVYAIKLRNDFRWYIGSSINIERRWRIHVQSLRGNRHHGRYMQACWNKYGEGAFAFCVLEIVDNADALLAREDWWLSTYRPEWNSYPHAGSPLGTTRSAELKELARQQMMGNTLMVGRRLSEETKAKIGKFTSERNRGRVVSDSERQKHAQYRGWHHTPETKLKISAAQKGVPKSDATKENMRLAWIRRRQAKERRS